MTMQKDFQYIVNYYNYKNMLLNININEKDSKYTVYRLNDDSSDTMIIWGRIISYDNYYYSLYHKLQQIYERLSRV